MSAASIVINQTGIAAPGEPSVSRDDLALGSEVQLTNANNTGVRSWRWTMVSRPLNSTSELSNPVTPNPTFTPDVEGTYLIELQVDEAQGGQVDRRIGAVRDGSGLRVPAGQETDEANWPNNIDGWWLDQAKLLAEVSASRSALDWKSSVHVATTAPLPANTLTPGAPSVLVSSANQVFPSVDGQLVVQGEALLVTNEVDARKNGIYILTQTGSASDPWILSRRNDADTTEEVTPGLATIVTTGATFSGQIFVLTSSPPLVLDVTPLNFTTLSASVGGNSLIPNTDNTLDIGSDAFRWRNIHAGETLALGSSPSTWGIKTSGTDLLLATPYTNTSGIVTISGGGVVTLRSIMPLSNGTGSLGDPTMRMNSAWFAGTVTFGDSLADEWGLRESLGDLVFTDNTSVSEDVLTLSGGANQPILLNRPTMPNAPSLDLGNDANSWGNVNTFRLNLSSGGTFTAALTSSLSNSAVFVQDVPGAPTLDIMSWQNDNVTDPRVLSRREFEVVAIDRDYRGARRFVTSTSGNMDTTMFSLRIGYAFEGRISITSMRQGGVATRERTVFEVWGHRIDATTFDITATNMTTTPSSGSISQSVIVDTVNGNVEARTSSGADPYTHMAKFDVAVVEVP